MLRKIAGCFLVLGALSGSSAVWALGLGDIQLDSALNQPLRAQIMLISATQEEVADLEVKLASAEAFESYGLDRPSYLFDLKFNLERVGSGYAIKVSSLQPLKEPFVTLLVEAIWARGRLLREYTVFLDPPVFVERSQPPAPVAAPSTSRQSTDRTGNIRREPAPSSQTAPRAASSGSSASGGDSYLVRRGDALWAIADRFRPTDATVNQMMIAIYRGNPSAFDNNINNLKAGVTLAIPNRADALYLGDQEANTQVRSQNNDWRQARGQTPTQASAAQAVLELVPPDGVSVSPGSGEQGDSAEVASLEARVADLEAELAEKERLLNLQSSELAELQAELSQASEPVEEPVPTTGETEPAPQDTAPVDQVPPAVIETPDTTVDKPEVTPPAPVVQTPEPSLLTKVVDFVKGIWLWLLIGLVGIGLAAVFMLRRGSESDEDWQSGEWDEQGTVAPAEDYDPTESQPAPDFQSDDAFVVVEGDKTLETGDATEEFAVDERLFEDTGTFTPGELEIERAEQEKADVGATAEYPFEDTMIGHDALQLDESDPLAEADFHMAYGLYDQAADLVSAAADKAPERSDLKVKLLEIFFVWGNKDKFLEGAKSLQESLGPDAGGEWDKIVIMGKQLCPDESLFSGEFSGGGEVDLALDDGGVVSELDLLTGEDGATDIIELDLDEALSGTPLVGGDVPSDAYTSESSVEELRDDLDSLKRETTLSLGDEALDLDLGLGGQIEELPDTDMVEKPMEDLGESGVVDIDFELKTEDTKETAVLEEQRSSGVADETVLADLEGLDELRDAFDGGDTARLGDIDIGIDDDATVQTPHIDAESAGDSGGSTVETLTLHAGPSEDDLGVDDDDSTAVMGRDEATVESPTLTMAGDATVEAEAPDFDVFSDETRELSSPDFDMTTQSTVTTKASISDFDIFTDDNTVEAGVDFSLDGEATTEAEMPMDLGDPTQQMPVSNDDIDEVGTKLDLARAFMDMGDSDGARSILEEVLDEGNSNQQQEAKTLIDTLS